MRYQLSKLGSISLAIIVFCLVSCTPSKKEVLLENFDEMYNQILNQEFGTFEKFLDEPSKQFYKEVTAKENLNIDSILVLGNKYGLKYMLAEYLALNGDAIKNSGNRTDFYRYLGSGHVSFFSFMNGYYIEKAKSKVGAENFVSLLRDDMTRTKRTWVKYVEDDEGTFKYDMLYTLKIHEKTDRVLLKQLQEDNPDKNLEECLRYLYWQLSGDNTAEYDQLQKQIELKQIQGRAAQIESYKSKK